MPELDQGGPDIERFAASIAEASQRRYIEAYRYQVAEQHGRLLGLAALRAPRHLFHLFVAAIGFYTRLGFRPTQALQFADGIAFLPMRRP